MVRAVPLGTKPPKTILPPLFDVVDEPKLPPIEPDAAPTPEQLVLTGPPGTGKTLRLMREGIRRANSGEDVLFVCYNKTLAAEMRRDFAQKVPALGEGKILATHIYALVKYLLPDATLRMDNASEYFRHMVEAVRNQISQEAGSVETFDTILIDESQDLSEDAIQLLKLISKPGASWLVAYGEGQELYDPFKPAPSLVSWMENASKRELRRNYRSGTHAFFANQAFYEGGKSNPIDVAKAKEWVSKLIASNVEDVNLKSKNFLDLDFSPAAAASINVHVSDQNRTKDLVSEVLTQMTTDMMGAMSDSEVNALIIVKGKTSQAYLESVVFLESKGLACFDLVQDSNKNEIPTGTSIRLVSHLSARGLSADFVVVFDFDEVTESNRRNISYVVLSRASKKTTVAVRNRFVTSHTENLVSVVDHVRVELNKRGH
jgi:superfamily I DNA and RNA helicase